jgi:hypothetical protein
MAVRSGRRWLHESIASPRTGRQHATPRGCSTPVYYLVTFIAEERRRSSRSCLPDDLSEHIAVPVRQPYSRKLKPIFLLPGNKVSCDIRQLVAPMLAVYRTYRNSAEANSA